MWGLLLLGVAVLLLGVFVLCWWGPPALPDMYYDDPEDEELMLDEDLDRYVGYTMDEEDEDESEVI